MQGSIPSLSQTKNNSYMTSNDVKCKKAMARKVLPIRELEKVWLSNDEACALLDCKRSFLENLRDNAEVAWAKIGGKCYYEYASIIRMFERHKVQAKVLA